MPELAEADVPGFLQIEAERGFHSDIESLHYATSRYAAPGGPQRVEWRDDNVYLTGWAEVVAEGEWFRELPR